MGERCRELAICELVHHSFTRHSFEQLQIKVRYTNCFSPIMESFTRINCTWMMRSAFLITFLLVICQESGASPLQMSALDDYAEAERMNAEQPSLYELLLQRELMADKMDSEGRGHFVVRKSDRSPSLRLRFGRRADPDVPRNPQH